MSEAIEDHNFDSGGKDNAVVRDTEESEIAGGEFYCFPFFHQVDFAARNTKQDFMNHIFGFLIFLGQSFGSPGPKTAHFVVCFVVVVVCLFSWFLCF